MKASNADLRARSKSTDEAHRADMPARLALSFDPVDLARSVFYDADFVRERRRRALIMAVVILLGGIAALFFVSLAYDWHFDVVWRYEAAGLLGGSVGTAELLSRYRDAPTYVLLSPPGLGYIIINAAASLLAMGIVLAFDWRFGASGKAAGEATQVLMAGFGAMALFRSSLLTVKAGNDDVGIGPSSVLSIMMAASDRSADRLRAADRAGRIHQIMADVSYEKAAEALPTVAVALMQNLGPADVAALNVDLDALKSKRLPDETKSLLLGLKITNVVSTAVLSAAKESLGASIIRDSQAAAPPPTPTNGKLDKEIGEAATRNRPENGHLESASPALPQTPQTYPSKPLRSRANRARTSPARAPA
jgi:hypothetical protein